MRFLAVRFHRDAVEHVDNFELPVVELDAPKLLVGQNLLRGQRAWPRGTGRAPHSAKGFPERTAFCRPLHRQQRINFFRVPGQALQVRAQRGAVALPGREFELGPGAVR